MEVDTDCSEVTVTEEVVDSGEENDPHRQSTLSEFLNKKLEALEKLKWETSERGDNYSGWALLPDICLEKIFAHLNMKERYTASMVCQQWSRAFYFPRTWDTFVMTDTTLARGKFNYYSGWQYVLDHLRAQMWVSHVGGIVKRLVIKPEWLLLNIYEFMNIISFYSEKYQANHEDQNACNFKIHTLRFIFWCGGATVSSSNRAEASDSEVYGTGGQLLLCLKRLISNLHCLKHLELIDLLLDNTEEASHLLDEACSLFCNTLETLTLINVTKRPFDFVHPACFVNLRILKITAQNIGEEMVEMLANIKTLEKIHIIQNCFTEGPIAINPRTWLKIRSELKNLRVYLRTTTLKRDQEIMWQEKAPVSSIIYDCAISKVTWTSIVTVIDLYSTSLQEYGHLLLPRFQGSRKFQSRIDGMILSLCRKCPYLTTLFVREPISTSTCLLIAGLSSNLRNFHVRRNSLILKCDYAFHNLELDFNFIQWIKLNARSYEKTAREIGLMLNWSRWQPLSDVEYKILSSNRPAY